MQFWQLEEYSHLLMPPLLNPRMFYFKFYSFDDAIGVNVGEVGMDMYARGFPQFRGCRFLQLASGPSQQRSQVISANNNQHHPSPLIIGKQDRQSFSPQLLTL